MSKITKLHFFGTSYTAGGGFEWECGEWKYNMLNHFYRNIGCSKTQFNYSYPGQLQTMLGSKYHVTNWAKNGYGNDRLYRLAYDLVRNPDFNKEENLLLFEFSALGRKELFFKPINDYIVLNYTFPTREDDVTRLLGYAKSYLYDNVKETAILENEDDFFSRYTSLLLDEKNEIDYLDMMVDFFIPFLEMNGINYVILTGVAGNDKNSLLTKQYSKKFIKFDHDPKIEDLNDLIDKYGTTILAETSGKITDYHYGYYGNQLAAKSILNYLVDISLINEDKVDIDYKFYREARLTLHKNII